MGKTATPSRPKRQTPAAAKAPTIAFVTTCKGRLHHLKQTLPTMAASRPDELIVVDYGCQDGTGDWVEANFPDAKVVRAGQPDGRFNVSRARNLGAAAASSEWLFFIDADVRMAPAMGEALRRGLKPGHVFRPELKKNLGEFGSFAVRAEDFRAVEGFDEVIEGWGHEDDDLYFRLRLHGLRHVRFSADLLDAIPHEDDQRHLFEGIADRAQNDAVNASYGHGKRAISVQRGGRGNLPLEERRKLMEHVRQAVGRWYAAGAKEPLSMRFVVGNTPGQGLTKGMWVHTESAVTIVLDPPGSEEQVRRRWAARDRELARRQRARQQP